ncbi:hypothetical protein ACFL15_01830 [Patescibacteria group bacterium]
MARGKKKFREITKTSLNLWEKCPRHFYYKYISNLKPTQKIINWYMILGKHLHHYIAYYLNRSHSADRPYFYIRKYNATSEWERYYTSSVKQELSDLNIYKGEDGLKRLESHLKKTLGMSYIAISNYWEMFKDYPPPLEVEKYLSMDIGFLIPGFKLVATSDEFRFLRESEIEELYPGTSYTQYPLVIDIKTGGTKEYIGNKKEKVEKEDIPKNMSILGMNNQAIINMVLFNNEYRDKIEKGVSSTENMINLGPVSFGIVNLMSKEMIAINYQEKNWLMLQNKILVMHNCIENNEFPPNASVHNCSECGYFHYCHARAEDASLIKKINVLTKEEEIETIVYKTNVSEEHQYEQSKLFKLPRKQVKKPRTKNLDKEVQKVIAIK